MLRGLSLLRNGKPYERHENEPHPIPSHLFDHRMRVRHPGNVRATATGRESPYRPLNLKRPAEYRPLVSVTGSKPFP